QSARVVPVLIATNRSADLHRGLFEGFWPTFTAGPPLHSRSEGVVLRHPARRVRERRRDRVRPGRAPSCDRAPATCRGPAQTECGRRLLPEVRDRSQRETRTNPTEYEWPDNSELSP